MDHCSAEGCTKPSKSRGMCSTCYNRTRPNRHTKVTKTCNFCGTACQKEKRNTQRYARTYCTVECRDKALRPGDTCDLPSDHWAFMFGATCEWTPPLPVKAAFQCGTCGDCGSAFVEPTGQTPSSYCSYTCARRSGRRRRRAREHHAPGDFTFADLMRQHARQGNVCAYCRTNPGVAPDPEHVLPLSRGGRNDMSNIVAACRPCNADKNDLTLDEWIEDRRRRGLTPIDTKLDGSAYTHLWLMPPVGEAYRSRYLFSA